jgi:hypothetical protein
MHGKDSFFAHSPTLSSGPKYLSRDSWIPESGEHLSKKKTKAQKGWGGAAQENRPASLSHSKEENVLDEEKAISVPETCDKAICGSDRTPGHLAHMEFMEVQDKNKQASSASAHTQLDPSRSACGPAVFAKAGQAGRMQGPCDIAREQSTHRKGHSLLIKISQRQLPHGAKQHPRSQTWFFSVSWGQARPLSGPREPSRNP